MYLPLWFRTERLKCLLVGGGSVALRKLEILMNKQVDVTVVSPDILDSVNGIITRNDLDYENRRFQKGDCVGFNLIIAATPDRKINEMIASEAGALSIPVNVVDVPELCTVVFSALHADCDLGISVSSSGKAPFLAAEIRNRVRGFTTNWGQWLNIASSFRLAVNRDISKSQRPKLFKQFIEAGPLFDREFPSSESSVEEWLSWLKVVGSNSDE